MVLHGGLDLHGDNVYVGLMDAAFNRVLERRLPNKLPVIPLRPCMRAPRAHGRSA